MSTEPDPTVISILLEGQRRIADTLNIGLAEMRTALDEKVSKADLARFEGKWENVEGRVDLLEQEERLRKERDRLHKEQRSMQLTTRQKVAGGIMAVALLCATVVGPVLAVIISGH